nr:MAG TPA: hypothetical protein [Caudoviricetes sp.]
MGAKHCPGLELLGLDSRACLVFHKPWSGKARIAGVWCGVCRLWFSRRY